MVVVPEGRGPLLVGITVVLEEMGASSHRAVPRMRRSTVPMAFRQDQVGGVAVALGGRLPAVQVRRHRDRQLVPLPNLHLPAAPGLDCRAGEDPVVAPDLRLRPGRISCLPTLWVIS